MVNMRGLWVEKCGRSIVEVWWIYGRQIADI